MQSERPDHTTRPRIVLIGAGHAHLEVLHSWTRQGLPDVEIVLIEPNAFLRYSGMAPGWIAGLYDDTQFAVDIPAVANRAGIDLIAQRALSIDANGGTVELADGSSVAFDVLSIASGGVGRAVDVLGEDPRLIDVRPLGRFMERWRERIASQPARICVVGGGAGGVELAFAFRNAAGYRTPPAVTLITGASGLLHDHGTKVRNMVAAELRVQNIATLETRAQFRNGTLSGEAVATDDFDIVVAAIGSGPPEWLAGSNFALAKDGFVAVDAHQRSQSHPHIFAAGDVARRTDHAVPHAGVHAVYAGPVLADNLRAAATGEPVVRKYRPRGRNLFLLSTGRRAAIMSWGPVAFQGRWVWRLKDWIDRRWVAKFVK